MLGVGMCIRDGRVTGRGVGVKIFHFLRDVMKVWPYTQTNFWLVYRYLSSGVNKAGLSLA